MLESVDGQSQLQAQGDMRGHVLPFQEVHEVVSEGEHQASSAWTLHSVAEQSRDSGATFQETIQDLGRFYRR